MKNRAFKAFTAVILTVLLIGAAFSLAACNDNKNSGRFEKEKIYTINEFSVMDLDSNLLMLALDGDNSYVKFTPDGEMIANIAISPDIMSLLSSFLEEGDENLLSNLAGMNVSQFTYMVGGIFPGFSFQNLKSSLDILERSLGLSITGLDFSDPDIGNIVQSIQSTGNLPQKLTLPETLNLALHYEGIYEIKTVYNEKKEAVKVIYVGEYNENSQPYIVLGMNKDINGNDTISLINEVIRAEIVAVAKTGRDK